MAQEPLTLNEAIDIALQRNRQIGIARLEAKKASENVTVARLRRLPTFHYTLMGGQLTSGINFRFPAGSLGVFPTTGPIPAAPASIGTPAGPFAFVFAQAAQPISQQIRIGLAIEAARLDHSIAREKIIRSEAGIVNDIRRTYYAIVQTQSALRATEETVRLFREMTRVAANALAQETILKADSLDAEIGLAKAESMALGLTNATATLKEKMNGLLGRELLADFAVSGSPQPTEWELDLTATRERAVAQRPEIREARLKADQAEVDRRAKKAEYIPDVTAHFDYLSPFGFNYVPKNVSALAVQVDWDIYDWGRKKSELAVKIDTVAQAKAAVVETETQVQIEVGDRFRKLQEARLNLRTADLELKSGQEKVRVAVNRYQQDASLLKDLLQMRASLAEKTSKYDEALASFWSARADLEKAVGEVAR